MATPESFGPFRVLDQIGAGALGPAYSAIQPELDCFVAVKQFNLGLPLDQVQRVLAQFDTLVAAPLDHLSIAASLGTGICDGSAYLIQEFARGTSLARLRDEGRTLATPDIVRVAKHVADAVEFAARAGIDHGGLKPQDILVADAEVRVTGFGVVRALERAGVTAPVRAPYAAPERLAGQRWDRRSDTYSLAAIVGELLTDRDALDEVFGRALSPNPADRFASATAFVRALQEVCDLPAAADGPFRRRRPMVVVDRPVPVTPPQPVPEPPVVEPVQVSAVAPQPIDADEPLVPIAWLARTEEKPTRAARTEIADDTPAAARAQVTPRRYSILWPLVLGPLAGVGIGLALTLTYVYPGRSPSPASTQERLIRQPERPAERLTDSQEFVRPVHLLQDDPEDSAATSAIEY